MARLAAHDPRGAAGHWLDRFPWLCTRYIAEHQRLLRGARFLWLTHDRLLVRLARVHQPCDDGMLRYQTGRWRGTTVTLRDGTPVRAGDPILRVHLNNEILGGREYDGSGRPFRVLRSLAADLDALAWELKQGRRNTPVALFGISLHARAAVRLGFERRPIARGPREQLERFILIFLMVIFHPRGVDRAAMLVTPPWPEEMWMSASQLSERRLLRPGAGADHRRAAPYTATPGRTEPSRGS